MEDKKFKVIIVEDVKLELKGTEEIFRHEIPTAEVIGTAMTEQEFWTLIEAGVPDLVLLDLGMGGSTTIGVDICRNIFKRYPGVHVLIFKMFIRDRLNAVDNEVTRIDLLMAGGRWQQKQPLQALFTNRMLREGTRRYDAARIADVYKRQIPRSSSGRRTSRFSTTS